MRPIMRQTGCYEFYLKNKDTGETARIISNCLANACLLLEWDQSKTMIEGHHETYGRILEKNQRSVNVIKTSEDFEMSKFCF